MRDLHYEARRYLGEEPLVIDMPFKVSKETIVRRNEQIVRLYTHPSVSFNGPELGVIFGVTKQRIGQLVRAHGVEMDHGRRSSKQVACGC